MTLKSLNRVALKLYQGDLSSQGTFDVRQDIPKSNMELRIKQVQVAPMLKDFLKKDFLEGTVKADVSIRMAGDAHLVKEKLDFRVEPKFVATIKGQRDTKQRSGIMVPVLVTGTFSEPKFRPDLERIPSSTTDRKKCFQIIFYYYY